jgi:hypothetical protein
MATWKKVVVSGSAISQLNNDSNYLVSGDSGVILSGSFSGSFQGNGSGLTGVQAQVEESVLFGDGLLGGTFNGATAVTASIDSGSLAGNGLTTSAGKFVVQNADSTISVAGGGISVVEANLTNIPNSALTNDSVTLGTTSVALGATATTVDGLTLTDAVATGSFTGSFTGNFVGTTDLPDLTDGNGIADFTYDGSGAATVAVQTDTTTGGNTKPVAVSANGVGFDISTIDGAGLSTSGGELIVNVDDSSIEINTDTLRVKAGGVTNTMLVNSGSIIGSTPVALGATVTSIAGLTLTTANASGSFSGSFQGNGSGLTGLASTLTIDADSGGTSTVDLLTQTFDIAGTANEIVTSVSGQTVTVALPDDVTIGRDLTVSRNLIVLGTASFQHTEDLDVADRFIRLASGSNSAGDGGIVIQQDSATNGEVFGFDAATTRFGVSGSFNASQNVFTPDAFMAAVVEGAGNDPSEAASRYDKKGNIFVAANEDIYIYS